MPDADPDAEPTNSAAAWALPITLSLAESSYGNYLRDWELAITDVNFNVLPLFVLCQLCRDPLDHADDRAEPTMPS